MCASSETWGAMSSTSVARAMHQLNGESMIDDDLLAGNTPVSAWESANRPRLADLAGGTMQALRVMRSDEVYGGHTLGADSVLANVKSAVRVAHARSACFHASCGKA